MNEEPEIKSVPVGISPLGHYFVGRQLMLRERLTREQWSGYDQHADLICNSVLKRLPVEHPESTVWDNRRK
ncbi:hypothetical protein GGE65_007175 [Skermanella aerolata]|uniref:hypothetical protein n=1 Tax=Skermanella aerolata TaxID=393310 RepID=UPI003D2273CB